MFEISAQLHKEKIKEKEIVVDTTVQEKNITFPTDTKLMCKIISKCRKIAKEEGIVLYCSQKSWTHFEGRVRS